MFISCIYDYNMIISCTYDLDLTFYSLIFFLVHKFYTIAH